MLTDDCLVRGLETGYLGPGRRRVSEIPTFVEVGVGDRGER